MYGEEGLKMGGGDGPPPNGPGGGMGGGMGGVPEGFAGFARAGGGGMGAGRGGGPFGGFSDPADIFAQVGKEGGMEGRKEGGRVVKLW